MKNVIDWEREYKWSMKNENCKTWQKKKEVRVSKEYKWRREFYRNERDLGLELGLFEG